MLNGSSQSFIMSAAAILLITGLAKVWDSLGDTNALKQPDPLFQVSWRSLLGMAGTFEIAISAYCLKAQSLSRRAGLIAWFSVLVLFYRLGLSLLGWRQPCHCLGSLTAALGMTPTTADLIMRCVLAYLLAGSFALLVWRALGDKRHPFASRNEHPA
jgi:hypothetical protein